MNVQTEQIQCEAEGGDASPWETKSRRRWRQQLRAVAPMLVMLLIVAACGSSEDDASAATTAPPPTPTTTTTASIAAPAAPVTTATPVTTQPPTTTTAAALTVDEALAVSDTTSDPIATYDGNECVYEGPTEFDLDSTVSFTVINESDNTAVGFGVWSVPDGSTAAEILEKGIFEVVGATSIAADEFYAGRLPPTGRDHEYELSVTLDTPGQHVLNCFEEPGGDHAIMFTVSDN